MPIQTEQRITVRFEETQSGRRIAIATFDRPPVNAIDGPTKDQIIHLTRELSDRAELGAVVLHGPRHFAAGDDIKEMATFDRGFAVQGHERISEAVSAIAAIPVPVVAAVTGFALGGGCELALAADFRVTAIDATWGLPEIHLGLIPGGGGTQRLPRLVGTARAKRMIYLGETITGAEAAEWGLADEAVPADRVLDVAKALATELASRAPIALRAAKQAIDMGVESDLSAGLALERALFGSVFSTRDAASGLSSFLVDGPRKARFEGR